MVAVAVAATAALPLAVHAGVHIPPDPTILAAVRSGAPVPRIATPVPAAWGPGWLDNWDRTQWAESRMGYPSHSARYGVANISHVVGILPLRYVLVAGAFREQFGPAASVAWRRLGLTHVVLGMTTTTEDAATASASVEGGRKVMEEPEWRTSVWEVPHRPWISFAPGAIQTRSIEESLDRLIESMAAGQPEVVLEGEPPDAYGEGRILSSDRGQEWVRVEATTDRPGLLVLNEAWSPGWESRIDGVPVRVLPADVLVRAVAWPAGHHVLEMRYEPKEARLGVWMSLVGAFVVLAMTVVNAVAGRW
jgi:hypothetical protein